MLERVALGQTRFSTPGLTVDARGVALGRLGVALFPSLDGVVGWLRLYSGEASLDDLGAELRILRAVTPLGGRAHLLFLPAVSSHVLDKAARCARLVGGATFTGSSKHMVKYRDERSPYGYDVVSLEPPPAGADLVLHADDGPRAYRQDAEVALRSLLLRLSLRRVPGAGRELDGGGIDLLVGVAAGLGPGLLRYLWRNRVDAEVAVVTPRAPGGGLGDVRFLLVRARELPGRVARNLRGVPGVTLYRPVAETIAVELGWEHPVELASCLNAFEAGALLLFSGGRDAVDVVAGPVETVALGRLVEASGGASPPTVVEGQAAPPRGQIGVPLRLTPTVTGPRRVTGALVPWEAAPRLKQLLFLLPPAALRGHRIAATERGLLVVAREEVELLPLGTLLGERLPGLFVPVGMDLTPRVAPEAIAEALGHGPGRVTVFPVEGGAFHVPEAALEPLERRALARLEVPAAAVQPLAPAGADAAEARIVNDPLGGFSLLGFGGGGRGGQ